MLNSKLLLAAAIAAVSLATAARADYPERPITPVVAFAPGGSTSIVARAVSDKMSEALGQKIIIDNRAGAGGTIGTKAVATSAPDGYTIALGYKLSAALADADVKKRLAADGTDVTPSTPEEYAAFIDRDEAKWSKIVKASGAKGE